MLLRRNKRNRRRLHNPTQLLIHPAGIAWMDGEGSFCRLFQVVEPKSAPVPKLLHSPHNLKRSKGEGENGIYSPTSVRTSPSQSGLTAMVVEPGHALPASAAVLRSSRAGEDTGAAGLVGPQLPITGVQVVVLDDIVIRDGSGI